MGRAGIVAVVLLGGTAWAQTPDWEAPVAVRATAEQAVAYAEALQFRPEMPLIFQTDSALNASPSDVRASLEKARADFAAERARILALQAPNLRAPGLDLTIVGQSLRHDATVSLRDFGAALDALDAMTAAQATGDCAAMDARDAELEGIRRRLRFSSMASAVIQLRGFATTFAGAPPRPALTALNRQGTPRDIEQWLVRPIVETLARRLRCPLPSADLTFEIVVRIDRTGAVSVSMESMSQEDRRAEILSRLQNAHHPHPPGLGISTLAGRPIRLRWANQRLERVPE
jgi:hypothetical protein